MLTRRRLLQTGLTTAAAASFGPAFWRNAFAAPPATLSLGPYGDLLAPDANGIRLPARFSSRVVARSGRTVPSTTYQFPIYPDGAATIANPADGGWYLTINSEVGGGGGGASAIRFDAAGNSVDAYRILGGTSTNCAGGRTPWGTWLSCEEVPLGAVWECDPTQLAPVRHEAMGLFQHEAACVDPVHQQVYLSEDVDGGGLYRFTPFVYPDLAAGTLEIACAGGGTAVVWKPVIANPANAGGVFTRNQQADSIKFRRGEGIWFDSGRVYLATTTDETIHVYDTNAGTVEILYRRENLPGSPLKGVDNVLVTKSGDLMIAEDSYDNDPDTMDVCLITQANEVSRFLKLTGPEQANSEVTSISFNPDGTRMYVGSQRYAGTGIVYEITGPFRSDQATIYTPPPTPPVPPVPPTPPAPPAPPKQPGTPLGVDVAKRISIANFTRRGLAVGITTNTASTVRVKITAKLGKKTVTLGTLTTQSVNGSTTIRIKPTKARAKTLRGRRKDLKATVEIRVTTTGTPTRTFKRTVTLRH